MKLKKKENKKEVTKTSQENESLLLSHVKVPIKIHLLNRRKKQ